MEFAMKFNLEMTRVLVTTNYRWQCNVIGSEISERMGASSSRIEAITQLNSSLSKQVSSFWPYDLQFSGHGVRF